MVALITRIFRVARFSHRRREAANGSDGAPTVLPPGEMVYDDVTNKIYFGNDAGSVVTVANGTAAASDPTNIAGASAITNIVKLTQTAYDALPTKDPDTFYIISG